MTIAEAAYQAALADVETSFELPTTTLVIPYREKVGEYERIDSRFSATSGHG
jgi:hypothetical protein